MMAKYPKLEAVVHAVEKKVRTNACLQRAYASERFHFDAALPFGTHVEVAQGERAHDETHSNVAKQETPMIDGE